MSCLVRSFIRRSQIDAGLNDERNNFFSHIDSVVVGVICFYCGTRQQHTTIVVCTFYAQTKHTIPYSYYHVLSC